MLDENKPMKLKVDWKLNLKTKEVEDKVKKAIQLGMKDLVTDIANDAIKGSPVLTGNNRRSIKFEVGPGGEVAKREGEGAIYSTSGYGGYLETGTVNMPAQPYFRPTLDKNKDKLPKNIKAHLE